MERIQNIRAEFASTNLQSKNHTSLSSSDNSFNVENNDSKILKIEMGCKSNGYHGDDQVNVVLPVPFLDHPLPPLERELVNVSRSALISNETMTSNTNTSTRKQFWKPGDYEPSQALVPHASTSSNIAGMDHVRVHPRFLHSNATSHKWVLGALAELLDNALDEVSNGATYVSIDMVINEKDRNKMSIVDNDRNRMLVVQDDGGGMNPSELRLCMSLGYSAKSKMANTTGQYGNGFKTSTMRLGSDVIVVYSLCQGKNGSCAARSIGMLSYTFLTSTRKEDIVVPMIDYEKKGEVWIKKLSRTLDDWHVNLESIMNWSPFPSEQDLLEEFNSLGDQGTKIVIYNLWEDDKQQLELDFDTDTESYASILYLRLPPGFRIILRGKDVLTTEGTEKDLNPSTDMEAFVTMGFVEDAQDHMDIQGFNVYHQNRLIKVAFEIERLRDRLGSGGDPVPFITVVILRHTEPPLFVSVDIADVADLYDFQLVIRTVAAFVLMGGSTTEFAEFTADFPLDPATPHTLRFPFRITREEGVQDYGALYFREDFTLLTPEEFFVPPFRVTEVRLVVFWDRGPFV